MRATVISVGSELLHGMLVDTNATFFTQELTAAGIEVVEVIQAGDSLPHLTSAFERATSRANLVISSGGIGPTADDLTREAIAALCGEQPNIDPDLVEAIRAHFARRGAEMPKRNEKQAWLIPSASSIPNSNGTAPGWLVKHDGWTIVALPGPPRENRPMWQRQVLPQILPGLTGQSIVSRTLKTIGIGESSVEDALEEIISRPFPITATYAKRDGVHVRITATHAERTAAAASVAETINEIRSVVGQSIYGEGEDTLAHAILQPLATVGVPLAVWEAGSAGRLTSLLQSDDSVCAVVADARASTYEFALGQTGAQNSARDVAIACARSASRTAGIGTGAALAVKLTDVEASTGLYGSVAVAFVHPDGEAVQEHVMVSHSDEIRRRATLWAAEFLWKQVVAATGIHVG